MRNVRKRALLFHYYACKKRHGSWLAVKRGFFSGNNISEADLRSFIFLYYIGCEQKLFCSFIKAVKLVVVGS
jgi:hypothetical protein